MSALWRILSDLFHGLFLLDRGGPCSEDYAHELEERYGKPRRCC